ncbi:MAG: YggT family protein [Peptococcaceae bacterium]|nr:YggT family protein [Peptococcaceae bacterium]
MEIIIAAVSVAFRVYSYLIIFRILLSWIRHNPYQPLIRFVYEITDPYLDIFRRIIPPVGMIDLSPIVAIIALQAFYYFIIWFLYLLI